MPGTYTAPVGRSTTQIFSACTQYAAATLVAALRAGQFGPRSEHRRILVVSDTSPSPELGTPLHHRPGFEALAGEFDAVRSWNDFIRPFHPAGWSPRDQDAPLWERAVRAAWEIGDGPVEIACESIQANPSQALTVIFGDSPVHIYADGLMSYGPTRSKLDQLVGTRIRRLLHLDLVPGLRPLLLTEFGVASEIVPTDVFLKVLADLAGSADLPAGHDGPPPALLLGQYLATLGILTPQQEEDQHVRMLRGAVALGHTRIVFKPHPSAPAHWARSLEQEAEHLGADLTVLDTPVLAETLFDTMRPALVVGCFSTALLTAASFYGLPVARVGTGPLLEQLTPYQNSNRVPLTIVDALLPDLEDPSAVTGWSLPSAEQVRGEPTGLLAAVGYAMQPQIQAALRPEAERYLDRHRDTLWRYFKRRRLTALGLPGAVPAQLAFIPRNATVRRLARRARTLKRAAAG
ncbi:polysialyltransferase family glycosyltransferase [Streptomyces poriferorum]|uniref:Polysialyltransferase family glycosyltransferase n=1 Tax=Streptomyces poriferorum TaxID=2798799 RepID=A0ABY9IPS4_9ACTN|nr:MULTISPECIES: polysialyltransferase family glycosyltransferase [unclassified Streptomyces]MDP5314246.1 polysialyltransferase family glycosyltransferase [Streptomyces sp. Alt4]WLQ56829.1 polysialyltransferase family glycosyltransferase [Streptomyces sp. Alt2]